MNRPAHARDIILRAAEAIVSEAGAAALTYDALVKRSGVTRGGITYHFPTREALLSALVAHDLAAWSECLAEKRAAYSGPGQALHAYIASTDDTTEAETRLCAGMLSAATSAPDLLEPMRRFLAQARVDCDALPDPDLAKILWLAADGLFFQETLGLHRLPPEDRARLFARLHALTAQAAGETP